jgi:ribosomal protein S18 acetylase RimI-like enzyme
MDPTRDLGAIASLMGEAFADDLDDRGRAALREMRWMSWLSPLVWWWSYADPAFRDSFDGFVWEEPAQGRKKLRVVGNVSLNRAPGDRWRWIICNVVVQDAYRGQGIGRQLTEAAIARARSLGAMGVVLQVHQDNLAALHLYRDLGFEESAAETELQLEMVQSVAFLDTAGYELRRWRPGDGQAVFDLAGLVTPAAQQWLRPVRASKYRPSWSMRLGQWFADLIAGRKVYRLVALKGDRLVAIVTVAASYRRGPHHLDLMVHPDHIGQVEAVLVSRALYMLSAIPPRAVRTTVQKGDLGALKVLLDYGFEKQRTLLTCVKDLGRV